MQWRTDTQSSLSVGSSYPTLICRAVFCYPPALWPQVSHTSLDLLLSFEGHMLNMCLVLFTHWGQKGHWACSKYGSRDAVIFLAHGQGPRKPWRPWRTESKVPEQPEQRHERVTTRNTRSKEEHEKYRKTKVLQSLTQAVFLALRLWLSGAASSRQLTAQQPRLCVNCSHLADFKPQLFSRFASSILNSKRH